MEVMRAGVPFGLVDWTSREVLNDNVVGPGT